MITALIYGGVLGVGAVTLLAWALAASTPCTCPMPRDLYVRGHRCARHEEQTEVTR